MFDPKCLELAAAFFADHRAEFPAVAHDALVKLLAQDIQDEIEGFFEFPDLTMRHLRRREEREREDAADKELFRRLHKGGA